VEHRNVVNFFAAMDERLGTEPGTWLAVTSLSFDISVLQLLWTLARVYKVVLYADENQAPSTPLDCRTCTGAMHFGLFYFSADQDENRDDHALPSHAALCVYCCSRTTKHASHHSAASSATVR
jgi:hypothetical protein